MWSCRSSALLIPLPYSTKMCRCCRWFTISGASAASSSSISAGVGDDMPIMSRSAPIFPVGGDIARSGGSSCDNRSVPMTLSKASRIVHAEVSC